MTHDSPKEVRKPHSSLLEPLGSRGTVELPVLRRRYGSDPRPPHSSVAPRKRSWDGSSPRASPNPRRRLSDDALTMQHEDSDEQWRPSGSNQNEDFDLFTPTSYHSTPVSVLLNDDLLSRSAPDKDSLSHSQQDFLNTSQSPVLPHIRAKSSSKLPSPIILTRRESTTTSIPSSSSRMTDDSRDLSSELSPLSPLGPHRKLPAASSPSAAHKQSPETFSYDNVDKTMKMSFSEPGGLSRLAHSSPVAKPAAQVPAASLRRKTASPNLQHSRHRTSRSRQMLLPNRSEFSSCDRPHSSEDKRIDLAGKAVRRAVNGVGREKLATDSTKDIDYLLAGDVLVNCCRESESQATALLSEMLWGAGQNRAGALRKLKRLSAFVKKLVQQVQEIEFVQRRRYVRCMILLKRSIAHISFLNHMTLGIPGSSPFASPCVSPASSRPPSRPRSPKSGASFIPVGGVINPEELAALDLACTFGQQLESIQEPGNGSDDAP